MSQEARCNRKADVTGRHAVEAEACRAVECAPLVVSDGERQRVVEFREQTPYAG